jgi:hypothetical protein
MSLSLPKRVQTHDDGNPTSLLICGTVEPGCSASALISVVVVLAR